MPNAGAQFSIGCEFFCMHAHLIEYGWNHSGGGRIAGRHYIGPALDATAVQVVEKIRDTMAKRIEKEKFPL